MAGMGTTFFFPEYKVCIDVAQGLPHTFRANTYLITHAHLDHSAGIPYIISQKALLGMKHATFYMPGAMVEPLTRIMKEWGYVDGHTYHFVFREAVPGEEIEVSTNIFAVPFPTVHRVPSVGYTLYERKKKLKPEFAGKTEADIRALREEKVKITEIVKTPLFSYTGDTQIEFWERNPEVLKSKILCVEATYIDKTKTVAEAREWGHTHLDEILPLLPEFQGEKLIVTHISSRYSPGYIKSVLEEKVPREFRNRVDFFPKGTQQKQH